MIGIEQIELWLSCLLRPIIFEAVGDKIEQIKKDLAVQAVPTPHQENDLVKVNEIAELTGYQTGYIYELVHKNEIPYHRVGRSLRFSKRDIEAWIRTGKHEKREATEKYVADYMIKKTLQGSSKTKQGKKQIRPLKTV